MVIWLVPGAPPHAPNSSRESGRLTDDDVQSLGALAAQWDATVEEARWFELVESWRGVRDALLSGRFIERPAGQALTMQEFRETHGDDICVTSISRADGDIRGRRIVVLNARTSPSLFNARAEHARRRAGRDAALRDFFLTLARSGLERR